MCWFSAKNITLPSSTKGNLERKLPQVSMSFTPKHKLASWIFQGVMINQFCVVPCNHLNPRKNGKHLTWFPTCWSKAWPDACKCFHQLKILFMQTENYAFMFQSPWTVSIHLMWMWVFICRREVFSRNHQAPRSPDNYELLLLTITLILLYSYVFEPE